MLLHSALRKINFYFSARQTLLLQMFKVTTTGGHAGGQALGEVCHCLVMCSCDSSCQMMEYEKYGICKATFKSSSLALAGVYSTFPARRPRRDNKWV